MQSKVVSLKLSAIRASLEKPVWPYTASYEILKKEVDEILEELKHEGGQIPALFLPPKSSQEV